MKSKTIRARQPRLSPLAAAQAGAQETTPTQPPAATVEIIGTSPLPGQGVDRNLLPYATQSVRRDRLDEAQADNLIDFMNRRLPGVQVNDVQGSPFQGDLTYRGCAASCPSAVSTASAPTLEVGPTLFANLAHNNRVPTVIELGCADLVEPCRLPAGLQADP